MSHEITNTATEALPAVDNNNNTPVVAERNKVIPGIMKQPASSIGFYDATVDRVEVLESDQATPPKAVITYRFQTKDKAVWTVSENYKVDLKGTGKLRKLFKPILGRDLDASELQQDINLGMLEGKSCRVRVLEKKPVNGTRTFELKEVY